MTLSAKPWSITGPLPGSLHVAPKGSRVHRVDTRQGSDSRFDRSHGNTYPAVARPHGMTFWTPQTGQDRFIYSYRDAKLQGFRATHSPSPWMGDYGHFLLMPITGAAFSRPTEWASAFRHDQETATPAYYRVALLRYGVTAEVTATCRAAVLRFTFDHDMDPGVVVAASRGPARFKWDAAARVLMGMVGNHCGGVPDGFACYVFGQLSVPVEVEQITPVDERQRMQSTDGEAPSLVLRPQKPVRSIELRIATSFISEAQAALNLKSEVGERSFDEVRAESIRVWEREYARHRVTFNEKAGNPDAAAAAFDAAVYRTLLFPRVLHEIDKQGRTVHYSAYDGKVHEGVCYTDNGFWDTHRTLMPWFARTRPRFYGEVIEGFMQAYRQSGWLPKWASPGHHNTMCSTHADVVIADAIVHDIAGFDPHEAYAAIRQHAFTPGLPDGSMGRVGLEDYARLGYVPADRFPYSVCRTLDFTYCDFCIAQAARKLGHDGDASLLEARSKNYRHVWDASVGFMRGRCADGSWLQPWDEFEWGGPYIEGGPWQHSWTVPHDPKGLAELVGGPGTLVTRLQQMLDTPPRFGVGHYGFEIHEMTEMAAVDFGQYAHSNQPVHHILWLGSALGDPAFTSRHVHRVCREFYRPTPDGLAGDEDNGEMSAWFLWACLGRYPLCPVTDLFPAATPFAADMQVQPDDDSEPVNFRPVSHKQV